MYSIFKKKIYPKPFPLKKVTTINVWVLFNYPY